MSETRNLQADRTTIYFGPVSLWRRLRVAARLIATGSLSFHGAAITLEGLREADEAMTMDIAPGAKSTPAP